MPQSVFISYKSEEFEEANWVKSVLEQNGISCWMAPESIKGGSSYANEIPQAIRNCKIFVLILSEKAQESRWVPKEIDQAINENKIILPFMLENCKLKDDFNFYLTNVQRYAAYENKANAIEKMIYEIKAILGIQNEEKAESDIEKNDEDNSKKNEEKIPDKKTIRKKDKVKVKKKKHSKKSKAIIAIISVLIIVIPIIALVYNIFFSTVTICGEDFKNNTSSVSFDEKGNELTSDDVEKIKSLSELSSLNLDNCKLPKGAVCELMNLDLYSLSLSNCEINDSDLKNLADNENGIVSLNLNNNAITDVSALAPLSDKLSELYIDNNPISDLANVNNFNLRVLSIKNIGLTDITPVSCLTELKELYIDDNSIITLEPLSVCKNLKIISVSNNSISNFKGLENSLELAEVYAENNKVNSLNGLENATVLAIVNLNNNSVSDISTLSKSKDTLLNLCLDNNSINEINSLEACTALKTLCINNNSIDTLQPLSNFENLEKLSAENNKLTSLKGLENAVKLNYIDLSDNSIVDIKPINNIATDGYNQMYLDLSNNKISLIEIPNVEYSFLNISGNDIKSISSLSDRTISKFIFDYSSEEDYSSFTENNFYHIYIVDCPLDKQLELAKVFGEYKTEFISADEIINIES